jgi:hypothetical protein
MLNIVARAGPYTRYYFQMGSYNTAVAQENWVAAWFLWHSFRYRDNRPTTTVQVCPTVATGGPEYTQGG